MEEKEWTIRGSGPPVAQERRVERQQVSTVISLTHFTHLSSNPALRLGHTNTHAHTQRRTSEPLRVLGLYPFLHHPLSSLNSLIHLFPSFPFGDTHSSFHIRV